MPGGGKAMIPAPIDRPLSRAYLREFTGWSNAFPPGLSEPNSLRVMENVQINRDGSARVRPGLRYLSYTAAGAAIANQVIGTHEAFYLDDGSKAYLFAVKENDGTVGFRVLTFTGGSRIHQLTDAGIGFTVSAGLNFTAATTYVKYLQIDNKIFALSNAGESMRLFHVGAGKWAKPLTAITRPDWNVADKLEVVHPDDRWITAGRGDDGTHRENRIPNPSFENGYDHWNQYPTTTIVTVCTDVTPVVGTKVVRLESMPQRTNLQPYALGNSSATGWTAESGSSAAMSGTYLRVSKSTATNVGDRAWADGPSFPVTGGKTYKVAFDYSSSYAGQSTTRLTFFDGSGVQVGAAAERVVVPTALSGRREDRVTAPIGAVTARMDLGAICKNAGTAASADAKNIVVCLDGEDGAFFSGASGTDYFWVGAANASASVYHPAQDVTFGTELLPMAPGVAYTASAYLQAGSTARTVNFESPLVAADRVTTVAVNSDTGTSDTTGGWTRIQTSTAETPTDTAWVWLNIRLLAVPRGEYHYLDAAMLEPGATVAGAYFDGDTAASGSTSHAWTGDPHASPSTEIVNASSQKIPKAQKRNDKTLISKKKEDNVYNFGFFYTFSNEVGESAASQMTVKRAQRGWSAWTWETPDPTGAPSGTETSNPELVADQLVASMPEAVFTAALAQGALRWSLYMFTWSDQDPVPVTAVKIGTRELTPASQHKFDGWIRVTPVVSETASEISVLPSEGNRYNFSDPSKGGQGLVAADRMILVYDPTNAAVIRWSSNNQGDYTNFTANKGGGYKTLTSGNLFIPACVKLWQNPNSVDTLTVLCLGTDGYSTGYYMSPAQVASQSEATNIMGFEETTATPGTTSPYGVEVFNNALYHPLDEQLMKSTASMYNINHLGLTDSIQHSWVKLTNKDKIVSSVHESRLYYLVHNPDGAPLEAGCWGNELWVLDAASKSTSWSRWLVQAQSLRKIEQNGIAYMSVIRPDGVYYLDPFYGYDDVVGAGGAVTPQPIAWKLETNTQGANRAHDAWAHVQQANLNVGNFVGALKYGIRAKDLHGQNLDISKVIRAEGTPSDEVFDLEDFFEIRRDLRDWIFYAESLPGELSFGQLNYVQYRYTPSTVNTGYEYGSVETFEYGQAAAGSSSTTTNGTPLPMIDTSRP